ncbi:MAG: hypothetical protein IT305_22050 [Chloroflexi bacterium]|nr:hypothetical protein [Chloroflexota bacterium]
MTDSETVPLTMGQRVHLLTGCLSFVAFVGAVLLAVLARVVVTGSLALSPEAALVIGGFLVVGILFTGWDALQCLQDLCAGVAVTDEDRLEHCWNSNRPGRWGYAGKFARLGRLRMTSRLYSQVMPSVRYRVVYSPVSKRVWAVEPVTGGPSTWFRTPPPAQT